MNKAPRPGARRGQDRLCPGKGGLPVDITVVGGMNLDLLGFPAGTLLPRDSNPGRILMRPGGVGRNIAARLSAMGLRVRLITVLGSDERAGMLESFCRASGIDLSCALRADLPSPCYLCVHDEKGDMAAAISDMAAMDALTPAEMAPRMAWVNDARACVLDANLPAETLLFIARNASVPLILDPVSCVKAQRVRAVLPYLEAIKPNQLEAAALTGESSPEKAARALREAGAKRVFISMGAEGVCFSGPDGEGTVPARPVPILPLTGAGDALCAGIARALISGKSTREAALAGCQAAWEALMAGQ